MGFELVCDGIRIAADALRDLDVSGLDSSEVGAALRELRTERSLSARLEIALTARAGELHTAGDGADPLDLLTGLAALPQRRAKQVVAHAELLARMPNVAAALRAGRITDDHVEAIAHARRRIDPSLQITLDAEDENITSFAVAQSPDRLAKHLRFLIRRLERARTRDLDLRRRRSARLRKWVDKDGMYQLHGTLDPEMGVRIFTAVDTAVEGLRKHSEAVVPGDDPDDPLGAEREFLAAHALARLVGHGHAAERPGIPEVVVLIDEHTLVSGDHDGSVCETHDGTAVPSDLVRRLCCEAIVTAVVLSADGTVPLNVGRSVRTATRAQRRALRAIHRTCAVDGCTVPFDRCEIHHVWWWELGGRTDLDNLVPLCLRHHHLVHEGGWLLNLNPSDRTLTMYRPDGSVYRAMRPPGLSPPADDNEPLPATRPPRMASSPPTCEVGRQRPAVGSLTPHT